MRQNPHQKITKEKSGRIRVVSVNNEPSLTQQQFKDECDVNLIIKKYQTTGEFSHRTSKVGQYADFSEIQDYQGMLHTIQYAENAFNLLPPDVRLRFRNDPGQLISYLQNPENRDEAIKLGLINAPATSEAPNDEQKSKQTTKKAEAQQGADSEPKK